MLKKSFILALFFASFTIFVQGQCLIDHLIIPTKDTNCRRGTLQFELQNDLQNKDSIRRAIDTFVIFKWGYVGSIDTTTSSSIVFPSRGNIFGEIWIDVIDTLNKCSLPRHTIIIDTFPYPTREKEKIIDTTLCINDTLVLRVAEFENVTELWWGNRNDELRDDSLTIVFNSENPRNSDRYYYFVVTYLGACPLDYLYINPNPYEIINDTVAKIFFARPPIIDLGVDTILCGNSHQLTTLDKTVFLIDEYKFRWNDSATLTQNIFTVLYDEQEKTQTITIEIWNEICRQRSPEDSVLYTALDTVDIGFWPPQWITPLNLLRDTAVRKNQLVTLNASAEGNAMKPTTYHWSGVGIDTVNSVNPIRIAPIGTYMVRLIDSAGCKDSFSITISEIIDSVPENCTSTSNIDMPNVFTPNNDGYNDFFIPREHRDIYNFHLTIYNRWGRPVYEFEFRENLSNATDWKGWDGRHGGSDAPDGVYFWVVKFTDSCKKGRQQRGTVTLLR